MARTCPCRALWGLWWVSNTGASGPQGPRWVAIVAFGGVMIIPVYMIQIDWYTHFSNCILMSPSQLLPLWTVEKCLVSQNHPNWWISPPKTIEKLTFKYLWASKKNLVCPLSISVTCMYKSFALLPTDQWLRGVRHGRCFTRLRLAEDPICQVPDSPEAPSATSSPTPFAPVPEVGWKREQVALGVKKMETWKWCICKVMFSVVFTFHTSEIRGLWFTEY